MVDGRTAKKLYHKFKLEYSNKLIFYDKSMKSNVIQSVSLFAVCVPTLLGSKFFSQRGFICIIVAAAPPLLRSEQNYFFD